MVDTPPSPPPREDNSLWKCNAVAYVSKYFPSALPKDGEGSLYHSYDTLERYVKSCYEAKSEAEVLACKSMLDPRPSLRGSDDPEPFSDKRSDFLKAFSGEYKDERSCLKSFTEFVDDCAFRWNHEVYLAPYTSLVQSSGTGKSRLLKEFANDRYVIYCCVRPKDSSGIPARSWIADKLLPARGSNEGEDRRKCSFLYASFICACIDHLAECVKSTPRKEWCEKQLKEGVEGNVSGVDFWKEIDKRMTKFVVRTTELFNKEKESDYNVVLKSEIERSCDNVKQTCEALNGFNGKRALLTFALDEARSLLGEYGGTSYFTIFRWMASFLKDRCGIFIVLVDTVSKTFSNFQPATIPDASYRYSQAGEKLFPPFYTVNTFNILAAEGRIWNGIGGSISNLTSVLTSHFTRGRPLFGSYIRSRSDIDVTTVVKLAVSKLLGGVPPSSFERLELNHNMAVALLSVRAAVFVKPQSELASSLVASHLGMCLAISSDRRSVFTGYPSEPVLAEAACHIMNRGSELGLGEILDPLLLHLREGIVEGGARGELVARLLFLLAWDHACMENAHAYTPHLTIFEDHPALYTRPLTVRQFLNSLADEEQLDAALEGQIAEGEMQRFLKGKVLFTHFTAVTYRVQRRHLMEFFESSAAVMCKRGEHSVDLIIPVWLDPDVMSYILVQVRNYSEADPKYKWASRHVRPEYAGLEEERANYPYLALYLSLGYQNPKVCNLKYEKHQDASSSAIPLAKRSREEPTQEPKAGKGARKRARIPEESPEESPKEIPEDPFQMIIGLFSLKPAVYRCLRDERGKDGNGEHSTSSNHLLTLSRAWTDVLDYVQHNKIDGSTVRDAKCSFVKETCVLTYGHLE